MVQLQPEWSGDPGEIQTFGPGFTARARVIEQIVRKLQPKRVLDVGCGRGNVTSIVAQYAGSTIATEVNKEAASLARDNLQDQNVDVIAADILALNGSAVSPIRGSFELVLLSEVLEHLEQDDSALASCFDLVAPGGHLLVSVPAHQKLWSEMDELIGHRRRYSRAELVRRMESAGFELEELLSWGFPFTGVLARWGHRRRARRIRESALASTVSHVPHVLSNPARLIFRIIARLESVFSRSDLGIGYVALATRQ